MAKVTVRLKMRGINRILREAQPTVDAAAKRKAVVGGDFVRVVSSPHRFTARAYIETKGYEGRRAQARDHILEQVVGS